MVVKGLKYLLVLQKARKQGMRFLTRVKTKVSSKRYVINESLIPTYYLVIIVTHLTSED